IILAISAARGGSTENVGIAKSLIKLSYRTNERDVEQFINCGYILGCHLNLLDMTIFDRCCPFHIIDYIVGKSLNDLFDTMLPECLRGLSLSSLDNISYLAESVGNIHVVEILNHLIVEKQDYHGDEYKRSHQVLRGLISSATTSTLADSVKLLDKSMIGYGFFCRLFDCYKHNSQSCKDRLFGILEILIRYCNEDLTTNILWQLFYSMHLRAYCDDDDFQLVIQVLQFTKSCGRLEFLLGMNGNVFDNVDLINSFHRLFEILDVCKDSTSLCEVDVLKKLKNVCNHLFVDSPGALENSISFYIRGYNIEQYTSILHVSRYVTESKMQISKSLQYIIPLIDIALLYL
ncbi:MAG: hypothetical protein O7C59_00970, partial [Rickettsia endosymbiont of Ixodes persulcatus]|nr:hypothetical protein [Rickettsia endosymbiont of Ixodes persulcatus]